MPEDNLFYSQKAYRKNKPGIQEIYSLFYITEVAHLSAKFHDHNFLCISYGNLCPIYIIR